MESISAVEQLPRRIQRHSASRTALPIVLYDIEVNIWDLTRRIGEMLRQAANMIDASEELRADFGHFISTPSLAVSS
jgi:hypothetical protein